MSEVINAPIMAVVKSDGPRAPLNTCDVNLDNFEDELAWRIAEMNAKYTHVTASGKNYVVRVGSSSLDRPYLEFFTLAEFKSMLLAEPQIVVGYNGYKPIIKAAALAWLSSPIKNHCTSGVTFYPVNQRFYNNKLNAYFGLEYEPIIGSIKDIQPYLDHIKYVICNGDESAYEYVCKWIAHMFQRPEQKPEVGIILKAGQGTGKGTFVDPLGEIVGAHYSHITKREAIVGRFNSAMENVILLFADEFFAGSKEATDKMKGEITEKTSLIERKGVDSIPVRSYSRVIMASNHDNIVAIEKDERRYLYLEVSEQRKQDHEYFDLLQSCYRAEGFHSKLLNYFLSVDISGWHPRNVPKTKALGEKKIDNLDTIHMWVYKSLQNGSFTAEAFEARAKTSTLSIAFSDWAESNKRTHFGDIDQAVGKIIKALGGEKVRFRNGKERSWGYELPSIEVMQGKFSELINHNIEWD